MTKHWAGPTAAIAAAKMMRELQSEYNFDSVEGQWHRVEFRAKRNGDSWFIDDMFIRKVGK